MADLAGKTIFVTGAGGFVGRRALAALVAAGSQVIAPVRSRSSARKVAEIAGKALMERADSVDVVVHLAYDVRASGHENYRYFRQILDRAVDLGARHFVYLSSVVVYDDWPHGAVDEASSITPEDGASYRGAKIAMERDLLNGPLSCTILQPTLIYGPGSGFWTETFAAALRGGSVTIPEDEGLCHGVYVADVAEAIVSAAVRGSGHQRVIVSGPSPFRWSELLEGYAAAIGSGGEVRRVPNDQLEASLPPEDSTVPAGPSLAARISSAGRRLLGNERFQAIVDSARQFRGQNLHYRPDRHVFELMCANGSVSIDAGHRLLGHAPRYDLPEALAEMKDALRSGRSN